jgi:hypothetical protein
MHSSEHSWAAHMEKAHIALELESWVSDTLLTVQPRAASRGRRLVHAALHAQAHHSCMQTGNDLTAAAFGLCSMLRQELDCAVSGHLIPQSFIQGADLSGTQVTTLIRAVPGPCLAASRSRPSGTSAGALSALPALLSPPLTTSLGQQLLLQRTAPFNPCFCDRCDT